MLASFEIIEPLKFPVHSRTNTSCESKSLSEACRCGAEPTKRVCLVAVPYMQVVSRSVMSSGLCSIDTFCNDKI